ncbi:hypothetical protein [Cycloclasticus pugetii]|uniref:hypothetical protein n=1 Tax=Cycloclasticus pugetii TaxID=34068 RepID=UPI003A93D52B
MAMTAAERKRKQREHNKRLGVKDFRMELAAGERQAIAEMAELRGYEDQTEYLLSLVYKDRDVSRKEEAA